MNLGTLLLDIPVDKVAVVVIAVPLSVMASASNVPSMSTLPDISRLAAAISPLAVNEVILGFAPDPAKLAISAITELVASKFKSSTIALVANKFRSVTISDVANVFKSLTISVVANVLRSLTISSVASLF